MRDYDRWRNHVSAHGRIGSYDYERVRKIVRLAAAQVKNPSTKSWLLADERGTWEKDARDLLEKSADKARELGMSEDQVNEEIANYLGYLALTASLKHAKNTRAGRAK